MSDVTPGLMVPEPGWYPDRGNSALLRWWDGTQWTEHTHSAAPIAEAFPQAVSADAFGFAPTVQDSAPVSGAPMYGAGAMPVMTSSSANAMATLAMILALVSLGSLLYLPLVSLALAGVIVGGVALRRASRYRAPRRGQAIAGIIVGSASLVLAILLTVVGVVVYVQQHQQTGSQQTVHDSTPEPGTGADSGSGSGSAPVVIPTTVEELRQHLANSLEEKYSVAVVAVDCDPGATMDAGAAFHCQVTLADGRATTVAITVNSPAGSGFGAGWGPLTEPTAPPDPDLSQS